MLSLQLPLLPSVNDQPFKTVHNLTLRQMNALAPLRSKPHQRKLQACPCMLSLQQPLLSFVNIQPAETVHTLTRHQMPQTDKYNAKLTCTAL